MSPVWTMLVVMVAFLAVLHLKNRKKRRKAMVVPSYSRRIDGFQVVAFLHPEISATCLFDHGVQFGRGFRRKEGPELPHQAGCRCATLPFSYSSSEVFHGALRGAAEIPVSIAGLDADGVRRLIENLKQAAGRQPLPPDPAGYFQLVQLDTFAENVRPAIAEFLRSRHEYLKTLPVASAAAEEEAPPLDVGKGIKV
ncbi:MAG: hypothetical protein V3S29_10775 [bacterium]